MLVDIFARRYRDTKLPIADPAVIPRLLMQAFRILAEDAFPTFVDGKQSERSKAFWSGLHEQISRELGLEELWKGVLVYTTKWNGNDVSQTYTYPPAERCKKWLFERVAQSDDQLLMEGLSLIELGFRRWEEEINAMNEKPLEDQWEKFTANRPGSIRVPGNRVDGVKALRAIKTEAFKSAVEELNSRFRQSNFLLHYHNGYIQISEGGLVQAEIEKPFWEILSGKKWKNVDLDMKEAFDRRDSGGRDPAFYAARALESTIKIISEERCWSTGKEKGAHNFIDNLSAKKNAYIEPWEAKSLKDFFTSLRNPFGHGPGSADMPKLSSQQIDWAIEFCMSWIKSLIIRL